MSRKPKQRRNRKTKGSPGPVTINTMLHPDSAGIDVAAAHKLARILYGMIKNQRACDETEAFKITPQTAARRLRNLNKQAAALGLQLVPAA
jgi:hypothetical protein